MSGNARRRRRARASGSGRHTARHRDLKLYREIGRCAASSFLASQVGVLPVPDLEDRLDGSNVDIPGIGPVRFDGRYPTAPPGMSHGLGEALLDGRDLYLLTAWGEDDSDEDELYDLLRGQEAEWLEARIGRDGMVRLFAAWLVDGPKAFRDRDSRTRPASVQEAYARWSARYFTRAQA